MPKEERSAERELAKGVTRARNVRHDSALRIWTRTDKNTRRFQTTDGDGPPWSNVERRITYDFHNRTVIRDETVAGTTDRRINNVLLPDGPRDIITVLYYCPAPDANPAGVVRSHAMADKSHLVPMMPCVQDHRRSRRSKLD
eukprot:5693343-Pyramimonas_sp.AAC.1